ncbi:MAG: MFS transporter [Micrococcales bacterium]|nr:MFS transporter [Micrococcales bacterium]
MRTEGSERVGGPLSRPYLEVTLAVLALVTIVAFESMAVSTAMPDVAVELHAVRSYGFAFSVMLTAQLLGIVLAGVWTDRSGPLPGTFVGQLLLAAGAATCGSATRLDVFLVGRALTGLGGGLLVVMLYVIAGRVYPEATRPRLFTYISAAWVVPSLAGPPLSAWLTENLTWRWVFWIVVVPVLVTVVALGRAQRRVDTTSLGEVDSSRDHATHVRTAWAGVAVALAAGALQLGTHELVIAWSWKTGLALVGLVGVVVVAPRLLPRGTVRMAAGVPSCVLARALLCAAFYGAVTYVPLFLAGQRHALEMLARSERRGCALGAAAALVLDWRAIRNVVDAAAQRFGVTLTPPALPSMRQTMGMMQTIDSPAVERAMLFGAQQLLIQHRGLWDLLEARSGARVDALL